MSAYFCVSVFWLRGQRLFSTADIRRTTLRTTAVVLLLVVAACGGKSKRGTPTSDGGSSDTGNGGQSTDGGTSGSGARSEGGDAAGPGGSENAGTTESGGAEVGGSAGGATETPACPDAAPTDGAACESVDHACFYEDCPDGGSTRAGCVDSVWHVRTVPCCPDTPPTDEAPCGDRAYYCTYDYCPSSGTCMSDSTVECSADFQCHAGDCSSQGVVEARCDTTTSSWVVRNHPCCPEEPPEAYTTESICRWEGGPDLANVAPTYYCIWQDCASPGVSVNECDEQQQLGINGGYRACMRFLCGTVSHYCDPGQLCVEYHVSDTSTYIDECVDNPCPPGRLGLQCMKDQICPTAIGAWGGRGPEVLCEI